MIALNYFYTACPKDKIRAKTIFYEKILKKYFFLSIVGKIHKNIIYIRKFVQVAKMTWTDFITYLGGFFPYFIRDFEYPSKCPTRPTKKALYLGKGRFVGKIVIS